MSEIISKTPRKTVYTVYGSEDGILGVTSNFKAAYRKANEYLEGKAMSYTKAQKACKKQQWVVLDTYGEDGYSGNHVTIDTHILESK